LLFATNGKFYSLDVAKLPGGRGHGEPIRMFVDMSRTPQSCRCSSTPAAQISGGEPRRAGICRHEDDCVGNTRKGKQVLNVEMPNEARALATVPVTPSR